MALVSLSNIFAEAEHTRGDVCALCASLTFRLMMARPRPLGLWFLPFGGYKNVSVSCRSYPEYTPPFVWIEQWWREEVKVKEFIANLSLKVIFEADL